MRPFQRLSVLPVVLLLGFVALAKAQPGAVLSHQKISSIEGNFTGVLDNGDALTSRVGLTAIGDLDNDGVADLAAGAPGDDDGGTSRGAVWILFMNSDGTVKSHQKISSTSGGFTGALVNSDNFGSAMAQLGDLDGDDVEDLVVGAPLDDDDGIDVGAVWVLFLNSDGTVKSHQKISDLAGSFNGTLDNGDRFGDEITWLGDLDGDNVTDIAVSATADDDGGSNRGAVWVLFLNTNGTVKAHQKISNIEGGFTGGLSNDDQLGSGLATLGDIDGDSVIDLAVGASNDDDGSSNRGAVWICFMNTNGTVKALQKISATSGGFTGTLDSVDLFGASAEGLGDVDGDGVPDIAVGAYNDDDGGSNRGAVWVLFLNTDGTVKSHQKISDLAGNFPGVLDDEDLFGNAAANLGDLDGDGKTDLAVGASGDDDGGSNRGAVWVLFLDGVVPPGVTVVESDGSTDVAEGGATDTYTIALNSVPAANVDITVDPDGQLDLGAGAGNPIILTFTPGDALTPQTVTVTAANDAVVEGNHSGTVTHSAASSDANYSGITIASVTANIADNDAAGVTITESAGSTDIAEGGATDSYTIVLNSVPTANVDITVDPDGQLDLGAGAGNSIVLTFTPGNALTPQNVTVTAANDAMVEGNHNGTITHSAASSDANYSGISIASVTANITDNDAAGVAITESDGSTDVAEGGATDTYTVVLTSEPAANVDVTVDPDGQFDLGDGPFTPVVLTFTPGNALTPQTITVTAVDDAVAEGNHSATIAHTAASSDPNYDGIGIAGVTANITDNDFAGVTITESDGSTDVAEGGATDTYTIVLNTEPTDNVNVTVVPDAQLDAGAGAGNPVVLTFTPGDAMTPQTITVTALDDAVVEGNHSGTITHSASSSDTNYDGIGIASVTANIGDNDIAGVTIAESAGSTDVAEGGSTDSYTIVLNTIPSSDVQITVDPDGQLDLGAGANNAVVLTFTPGDALTPQTVTVAAVDDAVAENGHTGTITHSAASSDGNYNGLSVGNVTANISDNDVPGVTIFESDGGTNVAEGGAGDSYTLVLNTVPIADVQITVDPDGQVDLGAGADNAIVLTFTPGNALTPQTVTVAAVNDAVAEGNHTGSITHAAASTDANYNGATINSVTAQITDDDVAGVVVTESSGSTEVAEGGASDTYSVVLNSVPTSDVSVTVDPDGQLDLGAGGDNAVVLTFTPGNALTPQTVTVIAVDDPAVEGNHSGAITHSAASSDANYNGITIAGVTASITDNDEAAPQLVFLAETKVTIDENKQSDGNIHSNGKIEFGRGGFFFGATHTGNLTAVDDITIRERNTIVGDATAGDRVFLFGNATVTGSVTEHASVAHVPLPSLTFTAGGPNKTVYPFGSLTLLPGSYGTVKVNFNANLFLSSGDYFMNTLDTESYADLYIDVSNGPVKIHVVNNLQFDSKVEVKITGTNAATDQVTFVTLNDPWVEIGWRAMVQGNLIAQNATVHFSWRSRFKGSASANVIALEPHVQFSFHSPGVLTKSAEDDADDEETDGSVTVTDYQLQQNYPNPFNPTTRIAFSVKEAGFVELSIYNMQGQEVRRLVASEMNVGHHSIIWNGRDDNGARVRSGVYLYKLRVNGFEETKKMTMMK